MCFIIHKNTLKETKKIKEKGEDLVAYKLLDQEYRSPFQRGEKWKIGDKIVSDRKGTKLTKKELEEEKIDKGLHFYRNPPKECPYSYRYLCQCPCPSPYLYPYLCPEGYNRWMKVSIKPKDLVAINEKEIVATRCEVIEEVK
jgi:hypothetical protein